MKLTVTIRLSLIAILLMGAVIVWFMLPPRKPARSSSEPIAAPVASTPNTTGPGGLGELRIPQGVITPSIQPILVPGASSLETRAAFADRVNAIRMLNRPLNAQEIGAFCEYLLVPASVTAQEREYENWLRNEMLDKLVEPTNQPSFVARTLIAIYSDSAQDVVMRDYAIQHIVPAYGRSAGEDKALLGQILWQATAEKNTSIAGTALLALIDLANDHREIDPERAAGVALQLVRDDECGELTRISAMQVCARMRVSEAAPIAMRLAQDSTSTSLRMAAIATLGDVGGKEAGPLVQQLVFANETQLQPAVEEAIKKLQRRFGMN